MKFRNKKLNKETEMQFGDRMYKLAEQQIREEKSKLYRETQTIIDMYESQPK